MATRPRTDVPQGQGVTGTHATAVIAARARVGERLRAGPYAVIEADAELGDDCVLGAHAVVLGGAVLGDDCAVHSFAVVGGAPQDRSYRDEATTVVLGHSVVVREHATVHRGTRRGGGVTRVADRVLLMVGVHIAHDCEVGEGSVLANGVQLAGHVVVEAGVTFGGLAAIAQCLRIGEGAMVAAGARVETDVPPWHIAAGDRARVRGLNVVGMQRGGLSEDAIRALTDAHRKLYRSGLPLAVALGELTLSDRSPREIQHLVSFLAASIAAPRRRTGRLVVP